MQLFLHEVHRVRGVAEEAFEAHYRDGWLPALAENDDARLLWYLHQAHGSGPAYHVVTVTVCRDGAAYERLAERVARGDLRKWARELDLLQHGSTAKLLHQVDWSPLDEVDLGAVPCDPAGSPPHALTLFMEDTGWPHVPVDDYTAFWGDVYAPMLQRSALLEITAVMQPAWGAGPRPEAILVQKIKDHAALLTLLETETPPALKQPGAFMHDALQVRDRWESRLLRTSAWSPFW